MSTLRTDVVISAKDDAAGTLKKIAAEFDGLKKGLASTKELAAVTSHFDRIGKVDTRSLQAAGKVLSAETRREITSMQLRASEVTKLAAAHTKAAAERERAMEKIGNASIREQLRLKDQAIVERRLVDEARQMHARAAVAREMMGRSPAEASRAAKERLAVERRAQADRLRAARDADRAATAEQREQTKAAVRNERARTRAIKEATEREAGSARRVIHTGRELGHGALGAVGIGVGALGARRIAHYASEQGAESASESVRQDLQGFSPEQIEATRKRALELSSRFPSISALQIREYARKATAVTGDYHHADELLESMTRAQVMLGVGKGGASGGQHDVETLVQAAEGLNRASSAAVLTPILNAFVKARTLYGDTVQAEGIRDYVKRAGTSVVGLDDSYLTAVVPSMVQEMGGDAWGTAQMTALGQFSRPVQKKAQIAALRQAGLLGADKRIVGGRDARKNPYTYAGTVLTDALKRSGINVDQARDYEDPGSQEQRLKIGDKLASWFPDRKASLFWEKQILDRKKIDRNIEQAKKVSGMEAAEKVGRNDPYTGGRGVGAQFGNLVQALTEPSIKAAAPNIDLLARSLGTLSIAANAHPEAVRRFVEGGAMLGAAPALWGAGRVAAGLAGEGTGVVANVLRRGGRFATVAGREATTFLPRVATSAIGAGARFLGPGARMAGKIGARVLPGVGEVLMAADAYQGATAFATGFGKVAAGQYWQPTDPGAKADLIAQRDELKARADAIEGRVHPSRRGEFNPEVDQLRRQIADLNNRLNSAIDPAGDRNALRGIRGSEDITPVGRGSLSFGLSGPRASVAGSGDAPDLRTGFIPNAPLPPSRPTDLNPTTGGFSGIVARVEQPIPVDVTGKVELVGAAQVSVTVKVDGDGRVTGMNSSSSGNVKANVGTSMGHAAAGGGAPP